VVLILNAVIIGALYWPTRDAQVPAANTATTPPLPVARQHANPAQSTAEHAPAPASEPAAKRAQATSDAGSQRLRSEKTSAGAKPLKPLPLPEVPLQPPAPAVSERQAPVLLAPPPSQASMEPIPEQLPVPVPAVPLQASAPTVLERRVPVSPTPRPREPAAQPEREQLPVWPLVAGDLYRQINADLRVNVHVYSKSQEERFVLLNMKLYHEGDQLREGPLLEEITQDGVVLSLRGERFRVPAR
jgi:hypothetical protein